MHGATLFPSRCFNTGDLPVEVQGRVALTTKVQIVAAAAEGSGRVKGQAGPEASVGLGAWGFEG